MKCLCSDRPNEGRAKEYGLERFPLAYSVLKVRKFHLNPRLVAFPFVFRQPFRTEWQQPPLMGYVNQQSLAPIQHESPVWGTVKKKTLFSANSSTENSTIVEQLPHIIAQLWSSSVVEQHSCDVALGPEGLGTYRPCSAPVCTSSSGPFCSDLLCAMPACCALLCSDPERCLQCFSPRQETVFSLWWKGQVHSPR